MSKVIILDLKEMHAKAAIKELAEAQLKQLDGIDMCLNCGLTGPDSEKHEPDSPWMFTFRFERDETVCKKCGCEWEHYSAKLMLRRLIAVPMNCADEVAK